MNVEPQWEATPYDLEIPIFFPPMDIPADNPLTAGSIWEASFLGKALSLDHSISCGSCHAPDANFSDLNNIVKGLLIIGRQKCKCNHKSWLVKTFSWDGAWSLEDHIRVPVEHPKEMNIVGRG